MVVKSFSFFWKNIIIMFRVRLLQRVVVAARQLSGSAGVPANLDLASAPEKEKLIVFDTSLRDGEQSPGVTLGLEQK